jgi:hypothetical protein
MNKPKKTTDADGRVIVAPVLTQRRAMALSRQILRVLGLPAINLIGQLVTVLGDLESAAGGASTAEILAVVAVVRRALPDEEVARLIDLLLSEQVEHLVMSLLEGATIDGTIIDRGREACLDEAYEGAPSAWGPLLAAAWVASEYRLFPLPGGSPSDTGQASKSEGSPDGSTSASDGAATLPS